MGGYHTGKHVSIFVNGLKLASLFATVIGLKDLYSMFWSNDFMI